jgi:antagonist of KipI
MDPRAHRLANILIGNAPEAATLEATLVGPELEFQDDRVAVCTGAEFETMLDGQLVPVNVPFAASAGSVLRFGVRHGGARAYLAVAGGIAVPPVFGSRATHLPSAMGGLEGRALRRGDSLPLGDAGGWRGGRVQTTDAPETTIVRDGRAVVRVLPGPQDDRFGEDALDMLQSAPYVVDTASNRMGFRLIGPALKHAGDAAMLSAPTPLGGIQVPPGGQPILLMADRQTTGGYPSIATVISADIGVAGQLAPGDSVSFVLASLGEAMAALIAQERALMAFDSHGR